MTNLLVLVKVWVILYGWSSELTRDPCKDTFQMQVFNRQICGLQQAICLKNEKFHDVV